MSERVKCQKFKTLYLDFEGTAFTFFALFVWELLEEAQEKLLDSVPLSNNTNMRVGH